MAPSGEKFLDMMVIVVFVVQSGDDINMSKPSYIINKNLFQEDYYSSAYLPESAKMPLLSNAV